MLERTPSLFTYKTSMPAMSLLERQIVRIFRDTGTIRIPEHDYYCLQDYILNSAMQHFRPGNYFRGFTDSIGKKDITRIFNQDNPNIDINEYLKQFRADSFAVYSIDSSFNRAYESIYT